MGSSSPEPIENENVNNENKQDNNLQNNSNNQNFNDQNNITSNNSKVNNNIKRNSKRFSKQINSPINQNNQMIQNNEDNQINQNNQISNQNYQDNKNEISEISEENLTKKNITNFKRINPDEYEEIKKPTKEERNEQKLIEAINNDDYDENNNDVHEYMFFPMKDGKPPQNIEPLLKKSTKKRKKMYTFSKDNDKKKENELAKILHINYDIKEHKFPYSIQKLKSDKPALNNEYLVIEYNMNKIPKEKREGDKKYELTSRTVHTNYKNVDLDNYEYTKHNGERYDYLDMNNDTNQIRRFNLMKKKGIKVIWGENKDKNEEDEDEDDKDEEKRYNEKEENEDRYNNKFKKGKFTISKIY